MVTLVNRELYVAAHRIPLLIQDTPRAHIQSWQSSIAQVDVLDALLHSLGLAPLCQSRYAGVVFRVKTESDRSSKAMVTLVKREPRRTKTSEAESTSPALTSRGHCCVDPLMAATR
jgi:hypothetical protein